MIYRNNLHLLEAQHNVTLGIVLVITALFHLDYMWQKITPQVLCRF